MSFVENVVGSTNGRKLLIRVAGRFGQVWGPVLLIDFIHNY